MKQLSNESRKIAIKLHQNNAKPADIGTALSCSRFTVYKIIKKLEEHQKIETETRKGGQQKINGRNFSRLLLLVKSYPQSNLGFIKKISPGNKKLVFSRTL